jgi:hypothetical protein
VRWGPAFCAGGGTRARLALPSALPQSPPLPRLLLRLAAAMGVASGAWASRRRQAAGAAPVLMASAPPARPLAAITTLLKTGNEGSVDKLLKQIGGFMGEITDDFKVRRGQGCAVWFVALSGWVLERGLGWGGRVRGPRPA